MTVLPQKIGDSLKELLEGHSSDPSYVVVSYRWLKSYIQIFQGPESKRGTDAQDAPNLLLSINFKWII